MSGAPREHQETHRQAIKRVLGDNEPRTLRDLSQEIGLSERDVAHHLQALDRVRGFLTWHPARCLGCGFEFTGRRKARKPSRCPECRSQRLSPVRVSRA
jgi:predicted Zn-ribbon and HTH transcriptional regulator